MTTIMIANARVWNAVVFPSVMKCVPNKPSPPLLLECEDGLRPNIQRACDAVVQRARHIPLATEPSRRAFKEQCNGSGLSQLVLGFRPPGSARRFFCQKFL
jgi:hypothetical protein